MSASSALVLASQAGGIPDQLALPIGGERLCEAGDPEEVADPVTR